MAHEIWGLVGRALSDYGQVMETQQVAQVRRFHRLVTKRAGAFEDHFLGRDRPLGESRVLYEIGTPGADIRDLRERLEPEARWCLQE